MSSTPHHPLPAWQQCFSPEWLRLLKPELEKDYVKTLLATLKAEKQKGKQIYPPAQKLFDAFHLCPYPLLKVVLLGQDPYHGPGQANGLSFSVPEGLPLPPSLRNIYKELKTDVAVDRGLNGSLEDWAKQGVLLLNTTLTVEQGQPASHKDLGWQRFTDYVIRELSIQKDHLVFLLWGRFAFQKAALIDTNKHTIIHSPHPSPFSAHRGFFGSKPFSTTNQQLMAHNLPPINW